MIVRNRRDGRGPAPRLEIRLPRLPTLVFAYIAAISLLGCSESVLPSVDGSRDDSTQDVDADAARTMPPDATACPALDARFSS